ncbi:MAG: pyridoxamine 5'-phosphate oxidase [Woeseiaceae bacterium]|nr:pyridoxamine 5'-phosphate oxidase family protein [Gammaproteobacteria bacterium]NNF48850.1 pyridoxamine 5'-phosphate oxidase [Woeseiaceae bacterium]NNK26438.1 pyridoxamine 5'-phosphate oxidase [Woeseiaceae bacterium]
MKLQQCIDFATEHPVCSLATVDGDQPRVRAFLLWRANEDGFYFETCTPKDVYEQLKSNPKVEMCFYNNASDLEKAKTMRLSGEVEFLDDPDLKKQLLQDWPFLQEAEPVLELFRIQSGEAFFWTMDDVLKEKEIERLKF